MRSESTMPRAMNIGAVTKWWSSELAAAFRVMVENMEC